MLDHISRTHTRRTNKHTRTMLTQEHRNTQRGQRKAVYGSGGAAAHAGDAPASARAPPAAGPEPGVAPMGAGPGFEITTPIAARLKRGGRRRVTARDATVLRKVW